MIKNIKFNILPSKKILLTKNNVNYSLKIMEDKKMAETIDQVIVIVGYLLAILIPILGLIVGVVLYFVKKEDPFYQKHAKYIIIVAIAIWIIGALLVAMGMLG